MVLRILVVGGGLAGLATSLALRRAGHHVHVFEKTQLQHPDTAGPCVHLGPRSYDLLRNWEYDAAIAQGVVISEAVQFDQDGSQETEGPSPQAAGWVYHERSRLHHALLASATAPVGSGHPVNVSLGTEVKSVDPKTVSVTLIDGQVFYGDVVVGGDGFHSTVRQQLIGPDTVLSAPSQTAVSFSVDVSLSGWNAVVRRFVDHAGRYERWAGDGLQLSIHAVEPGCLLFDTTVPTQRETGGTSNSLKSQILQAFKSSQPDLIQLLSAIKLEDIRTWSQASCPTVDQWTSGSVALVGDAAHPFLPHELPGTSQTFNDAASLATELGSDVTVGEVAARLAAWVIPRKDRVRVIQQSERGSWFSSS